MNRLGLVFLLCLAGCAGKNGEVHPSWQDLQLLRAAPAGTNVYYFAVYAESTNCNGWTMRSWTNVLQTNTASLSWNPVTNACDGSRLTFPVTNYMVGMGRAANQITNWRSAGTSTSFLWVLSYPMTNVVIRIQPQQGPLAGPWTNCPNWAAVELTNPPTLYYRFNITRRLQ